MTSPEVVTNEIMIVPKRMDVAPDGTLYPSAISWERLNFGANYFHRNRVAFESKGAQIIVAGGASVLESGHDMPEDVEDREGTIQADFLMRRGVPHEIIRVENESRSTLTNIINCIRLGYIDPANYSAEHPLGFVTNPDHMLRVMMYARWTGMRADAILPLPTPMFDNVNRERIARGISRTISFGVIKNPKTADKRERTMTKLEKREDLFASFMKQVRHVVPIDLA